MWLREFLRTSGGLCLFVGLLSFITNPLLYAFSDVPERVTTLMETWGLLIALAGFVLVIASWLLQFRVTITRNTHGRFTS